MINGVTVTDRATGNVYQGTVDLQPTLDRIASGVKYPSRNDGATFNNNEGLLPQQPAGYYTEYVVPTPSLKGVGPQRIVTGKNGEGVLHARSLQDVHSREKVNTMKIANPFRYEAELDNCHQKDAFVAVLPSGIGTKSALLEALASVLAFLPILARIGMHCLTASVISVG